jgi:broad specificity phosphatase PhoE
MSSLTLVRHGRASFDAEHYDLLSEVGEVQSRLLGEHWARRGLAFGEVYTGTLARQRETAERVGAACRAAGLPWPEPVVLPELDEFDLGGLATRVVPELARADAAFGDLLARYHGSAGPERERAFQKMFEVLIIHWASLPAADGVEGWPTFRDRVRGALRRLQDMPGQGRRVVAFTSGGFIGTAVQLALAAPDRAALELSWRVRNGSLTEFVFTRDRLTLDGFNAVPHLEDPTLWTYR